MGSPNKTQNVLGIYPGVSALIDNDNCNSNRNSQQSWKQLSLW